MSPFKAKALKFGLTPFLNKVFKTNFSVICKLDIEDSTIQMEDDFRPNTFC